MLAHARADPIQPEEAIEAEGQRLALMLKSNGFKKKAMPPTKEPHQPLQPARTGGSSG
jgi:hypothetical protein